MNILKNLVLFGILFSASAFASEIKVSAVKADLSKIAFDELTWKDVKAESVMLMAQPMAIPRPSTTNTSEIMVQALQDGERIAFRLKWKVDQMREAGKLAEFSDAVAIEFPVKNDPLPPVFMGAKDQPVHLFHWRAQYQRDLLKGKPEMKDLYPNMNPDMYPMEFKDSGHLQGLTEDKREIYSPAKAVGNPQSYAKLSAVDEVFAEGFGSSAVTENKGTVGHGVYSDGQWSVVIVRPLKREGGSILELTKDSNVGFAVWQGAKQEVGARKCITMAWVPLKMAGN